MRTEARPSECRAAEAPLLVKPQGDASRLVHACDEVNRSTPPFAQSRRSTAIGEDRRL